ncbi:MAG: tetraacyldisaccharide 4'-kinase [Gammaproteobacteria bacterium]|nr:tetraacyldisaccharide 4'-kinase [Gammaproteobacteria bacterium]
MPSWFESWVNALWYGQSRVRLLLWPLSIVFQGIGMLRRKWLEWRRKPLNIPVIVVGNLTVGGVGKTPLVIALAQQLSAKGLRVGIVSRGYGANVRHFPHEVSTDDDAKGVGDEPKLIALKTRCPVVIAPKRLQAVHYLLKHHHVQIIISDDGLQHYAMPRAIEIAVVDGMRGFGSGRCLPAGPLRESPRRLEEVDFIVVNGAQRAHTHYPRQVDIHRMDLQPGLPQSLETGASAAWSTLAEPFSAVAGIGHPERFFELLRQLGVAFEPHDFPDHHVFVSKELERLKKPVLMTEKDAVKCRVFATESMYCLPVEAKLSDEFWTELWSRIT